MRARLSLSATFVMALVIGCHSAQPDAEQMQGSWQAVSMSDNKQPGSADDIRQTLMTVSGTDFLMREDAETPPRKFAYRLDPAKSPKEIDFTFAGKDAYGIYILNGDRLQLAMAQPGAPRPKDFQPAERTMVLELERTATPVAAPADAKPGAPDSKPPSESETKSATDARSSASHKPSSRELAYGLGYDLSLAAFAYAKSLPKKDVDSYLDKARREAKALGVTLPDFPERKTDKAETMAVMLHYVLVDSSKQISGELKAKSEPGEAALFELATKTSALSIIYSPNPTDKSSLGELYREAGPKAGLPESVWKPLVDKLDAKKPASEITDAVAEFHAAVFEALAKEASEK